MAQTQELDRKDAIEVTLDLVSFAGGENTIGQDQELKSNEARVIENWDSDSLGGMIRSKGFSLIAQGLNNIDTDIFTGSGLNDLTPGGTYLGISTSTFTVIIDAAGGTDTFKWKKDSGSFTAGVAMTGGAQTLSDGVTVSFAATTGHTANDQWTIRAVSYTMAPDLFLHHFEGTNTRNYLIIEGDLVRVNGISLMQTDPSAFTTGILSHGVSAGNKAWITNSTDNLKYATIAGAITVPASQPSIACDRIYEHKGRLVAEGGSKTVFGSRAGTGFWTAGNAWSSSGDAWNIDLPDTTEGCVPGWPSGNEITVFTKFGAHSLYNMPNIARRFIIGSHGCSQPLSIALGAEGVYFFSLNPTRGVYLWDGSNWTNLTVNETWANDVSLTNRCYGVYSENKYRIFYNEIGSGVTYPNVERVYDARWGRWMKRNINPNIDDNFGYPGLLTKTNNELYCVSSRVDKLYQLEDDSNSDNGENTLANYKTKDFTSLDFGLPIDETILKLVRAVITYYGTIGSYSLQWTSDRGLHSGQIVSSSFSSGDLLNDTFIMNQSFILSIPPDRTVSRKFSNGAVGRRFSFQLLNSAIGDRLKIKKIKIVATVMGDSETVSFATPSSPAAGGGVILNTDNQELLNTDDNILDVT